MFAVLEKGAVFVRVGATARVDWSAATPLIIPSAIRVTLSPSGAETMALGSIMRVRASCVLTRVRRRVKLRRLRKSGRRGKERRRKEKKKKKEKEWKREAVTNDRRWIADPNLESRVAVSKIRPREKRVSQSLIASSSRSCVIGTSLIAWYSFSFLLLWVPIFQMSLQTFLSNSRNTHPFGIPFQSLLLQRILAVLPRSP